MPNTAIECGSKALAGITPRFIICDLAEFTLRFLQVEMNKKSLFLTLWMLLLVPLCFADTVYLKDGNLVRGEIVEKTNGYVKMNISGVFITYFKREIDRIEYGDQQTLLPEPMPEVVVPPVDIPSPNVNVNSRAISENKKQLILRFIEVSSTRDNMLRMFSGIMAETPLEQRRELAQILSVDEISLRLVPIYDKYFTEEELQQLILFYKSAVGSKLIAVTPLIMEDSLKASKSYFLEKLSTTNGND